MVLRAIIVINKETGQKNVTLTREMLAPTEDFVPSGDWINIDVLDRAIEIYATEELEHLLDCELRSVDNVHDMTPSIDIPLSELQMESAIGLLDNMIGKK